MVHFKKIIRPNLTANNATEISVYAIGVVLIFAYRSRLSNTFSMAHFYLVFFGTFEAGYNYYVVTFY